MTEEQHYQTQLTLMSNRALVAQLHAEAESLRRERSRPMETPLLEAAAAHIAQLATREQSAGIFSRLRPGDARDVRRGQPLRIQKVRLIDPLSVAGAPQALG